MSLFVSGDLCLHNRTVFSNHINDPKILVFVENRNELEKENRYPFLAICEIDGRLIPIEKNHSEYIYSELSLEEALFKICERPRRGDGVSIQSILLHKDFEMDRFSFIEQAFSLDDFGVPKIFHFSNAAAADVIEIGSKFMQICPLQIMDIRTKKNLLVHSARWIGQQKGSDLLLIKLIQKFPSEFFAVFFEMIEDIFLRIHSIRYLPKIVQEFEIIGGQLDSFYKVCILNSQCQKLPKNFSALFSDLSVSQKELVYKYAHFYNNPFIYKKLAYEIPCYIYSLNFMWISKRLKRQEYLFGEGLTPGERTIDFQNRLVIPIIKWAQKNPNTAVNIWYDSQMTYLDAIERSKQMIEAMAPLSIRSSIKFRDIRVLDLVSKNSQIFRDSIPVYFRVDLLRAIIADQMLTNQDVQYFVYGDLDMKPIKRHRLFDERTVKYLSRFGFVMAKVQTEAPGFENGFQILSGEHAQLLEAHRKIIIDLNIEMANSSPREIEEQQIFHCYSAMFTYLLEQSGLYGKLDQELLNKVSKEEQLKLHHYRFEHFRLKENRYLPLGPHNYEIKRIFPTKPVQLPPSHFA